MPPLHDTTLHNIPEGMRAAALLALLALGLARKAKEGEKPGEGGDRWGSTPGHLCRLVLVMVVVVTWW